MTEEQSGKLVDCIDFLISEIRRLRIDVAEGRHPTLAERIKIHIRERDQPTEPVHTYISRFARHHGGREEFYGAAAIAGYAMKMEELLIELIDDATPGITPLAKARIRVRMGWK